MSCLMAGLHQHVFNQLHLPFLHGWTDRWQFCHLFTHKINTFDVSHFILKKTTNVTKWWQNLYVYVTNIQKGQLYKKVVGQIVILCNLLAIYLMAKTIIECCTLTCTFMLLHELFIYFIFFRIVLLT